MKEKDVRWVNEIVSDSERGEIMLSGQRHVIVDAYSFRAYRDAISEIIGHGADAVLYLAGKRHTKSFVKRAIKKSMLATFVRRMKWGRNKITEKIVDILNQYGFGAAVIEKLDYSKESVIVIDNSCIATTYEKKQKKPTCSYISGLIAGGAEAITGKTYECHETHCVAAGDKHCRFVLKRES